MTDTAEELLAALKLAEDVLSRYPYSAEIWPNGMHPHVGITRIRDAIAATGAQSITTSITTVPELPLLPEQAGWAVEMHGELVLFANNAERARGFSPGATKQIFTADQMRAYAQAAITAERAKATAPASRKNSAK